MLAYIVGRHSSWAIAAFLFLGSAMGCGDDGGDGDNDTPSAGKGGTSSGGKGGSASGGKGGSSASNVDAGPASDALQGTGDKCHSYSAVEGDKCQGWFCGVTEQQLKDAVNPNAKCGGNVALLCKGSVTIKVGECARQEKLADFSASNEVLRPRIRECVYKDEDIKNAVPENCLDCTIDVAACAGDNCVGPCLTGDSEACDNCRLENHC